LLRSRRYTRTSPSSIRCVSSRSCRMSCSSQQHYGRAYQQVYQSVCLKKGRSGSRHSLRSTPRSRMRTKPPFIFLPSLAQHCFAN